MPGFSTSSAYGINASGQVVGLVSDAATSHAFLYNPGSGMTDLGTLPGYAISQAIRINASGQVAGNAFNYSGNTTSAQAFVWSPDSGMTALGALPGDTNSMVLAINDGGQVLGGSWTTGAWRPFLWSSGSGMTDLSPVLANSWQDINNSGQIVGGAYQSGVQHANLYNPGSGMTDLGTLLGYANSSAFVMNGSGQVAGESYNSSSETRRGIEGHVFVWSASGGMIDLGILPGTVNGFPTGINASGQVVGNAEDASASEFFAFVGSASTGLTDLNSLLFSNPAGWNISAQGINDAGVIVGFGSAGGQYTAILLTPTTVPIPAAVWLFGSALAGLIGISRRRNAPGASDQPIKLN